MAQVTLNDVLDLNKTIIDEVRSMRSELSERMDKVEQRTSILENFKSELAGKLAIIGAVVVIGANLLFEAIKERFLKHI